MKVHSSNLERNILKNWVAGFDFTLAFYWKNGIIAKDIK